MGHSTYIDFFAMVLRSEAENRQAALRRHPLDAPQQVSDVALVGKHGAQPGHLRFEAGQLAAELGQTALGRMTAFNLFVQRHQLGALGGNRLVRVQRVEVPECRNGAGAEGGERHHLAIPRHLAETQIDRHVVVLA
jgi:hypothetical protein